MDGPKTFVLRGKYVSGWQSASENWELDVCANQKDAFPEIDQMFRGTFNVRLIDPPRYVPVDIPQIRAKKDASCISKIAKVIKINESPIEAFIYDGGWPADTIELLSAANISEMLDISPEDSVTLVVQEFGAS
jgi:hypothetical protein